MIYRITRLTCMGCGETQRVKIRLVSDTEVMPDCSACGPTTWLALPTLRIPVDPPRVSFSMTTPWGQFSMGYVHEGPQYVARHDGCGECHPHPMETMMGQCGCECHRRSSDI